MLDGYRSEIIRRCNDGATFDEIEGYLESLALPEHAKGALWLLAWSYQPRREQRRLANETLTLVHE